jgi:hypothetical protein
MENDRASPPSSGKSNPASPFLPGVWMPIASIEVIKRGKPWTVACTRMFRVTKRNDDGTWNMEPLP